MGVEHTRHLTINCDLLLNCHSITNGLYVLTDGESMHDAENKAKELGWVSVEGDGSGAWACPACVHKLVKEASWAQLGMAEDKEVVSDG